MPNLTYPDGVGSVGSVDLGHPLGAGMEPELSTFLKVQCIVSDRVRQEKVHYGGNLVRVASRTCESTRFPFQQSNGGNLSDPSLGRY